MYCPTCGSEERQLSQFCRSCGTDLRSVRVTLEKHDPVTASAVTARDRISQAVAEKIREAQSASELHKVAEDVLPEIEKFLESPEERRLRRVRTGVIISFIGIGAALGGAVASMQDENLFVLMVPGITAFCIGLALILNGLLFTVTRKRLPEKVDSENSLPESLRNAGSFETGKFSDAAALPPPTPQPLSVSVTEHTTKHLSGK
jgi:hypothetical protein